MIKMIQAGTVILTLSVAFNIPAITVEVTSMVFGESVSATGLLTSIDNAPVCYQHGYFSSYLGSVSTAFFGVSYSGPAFEYFDTVGVELHFSGVSPSGTYDYAFTLSEGQVAWGLAFV